MHDWGDACEYMEKLEERCEQYKGQVKAGSDEIDALKAELAVLRGVAQAVPDSCQHAFRAADDIDWSHLDQFIPHSGHGQFWRAVFKEVRAALAVPSADRGGK